MPRSHPRYAPEYRQRIIELARAGRSLSELARQFEPAVETIRLWVK
jgi:transposase-like protein